MGILDNAGNWVVEYTYDAWGAPTSLTGSMASTLGVINPFRYRGYVYDQETGLYYLRSRYYNPAWCRFVNADSTCGVISRIFAHAVFAYCNNAPTMRMDYEGNESLSVSQSNSDTLEPVIRSLINAICGAERCSALGEFSITSITYDNTITKPEATSHNGFVEGIVDAIAWGTGAILGGVIGSGSWLARVSDSILGGLFIDKTSGYAQDFFVDLYTVRAGTYTRVCF